MIFIVGHPAWIGLKPALLLKLLNGHCMWLQRYLEIPRDMYMSDDDEDVAGGSFEALPAAKRFQMFKLLLDKCPAGSLSLP